jgi:hypothetical protein
MKPVTAASSDESDWHIGQHFMTDLILFSFEQLPRPVSTLLKGLIMRHRSIPT